MKITHVCLVGPVTDGFSYQDNLLSKYHKKLGYDVDFIASEWVWGEDGQLKKDSRSSYENEDGVRVIRLPLIGKDFFDKKIKLYHGFKEAIQKSSPDIIFVHGPQFLQMKTIGEYIVANPDVILFVDNHADFSNSATNWLSKNILHKILWRHMAKSIEPYVKKFYGVLPARVDFLVDVYKLPTEKCELLVMGADDEKVEEAKNPEVRKNIRTQYGIEDDDFLIMTGGKIDLWKTQTLLLMEAVNNIKNKKVKLIVFGSVTPELKEKVNVLADGVKVQYIGWVASEQSYEYWSAADIAVFPGRHSVFWEQVAGMGIPMICKYWDGTTHVDVGGNVKFLNKDSVEEIQNLVQELIDKPDEYKKMLEVAQSKGKEKFSYKEIARRSINDFERTRK